MSKEVLIGGGSGLIGRRLTEILEERDFSVRWLSRSPEQYDQQCFYWNPAKHEIDPAALDGVDTVIQLAGAGIADERWTEERKKVLRNSRIESHNTILNAIEEHDHSPSTYIAPSAIGYYGDRGDDWLTEESDPGEGFLPELCQQWESASSRAAELGMRLVQFRIGIVLSTEGGMLDELIPYFKWGIGTVFGSGEQYYSWIHIDDLCGMFLFAMQNEDVSGIYNAVAPNPVPNEHLARAIRSTLKRPGILAPAPAFVLKIMLGEMSVSLLDSARVSCEKIREEGFSFQFAELHAALEELLD